MLIAISGMISSCSHKTTAPATVQQTKTDSVVQQAIVVLKPLSIDTVSTSLTTRIPAVETAWKTSIAAKTEALYRANGYQTIWLFDQGPSPLYAAARQLLNEAYAQGLDPLTYADPDLAQRIDNAYHQADSASLAELDIAFTEKVLMFTTHVSEGRIMSVANGKNIWKRTAAETSMKDVDMLSVVHTPEDLFAGIARIEPQHQQYTQLKRALAAYRNAEQHDTQPISVPSSVKPGDRSPAIPLVRKKVSYLNNLSILSDSVSSDLQDTLAVASIKTEQVYDSLYYDPELAAEVQLFQRRHGLTSDGVIGERTLKFMNQKISERVAQIAVNMDRLRWMPAINSERYLLVNIPEYKLTVYEGSLRAFDMRVIVGSPATPTPVFNDRLNHIVFSPTWTVPTSIIRNEIIPNLKKDSTYYSEKNFVIYKQDVQIDPALENWKDPNINPYQLRVVQNPGADNSLGSVKFMMPNNMSVYLHDTPSRRLFSKDYRALSHGCVRLGEPAKLAAYLLKDQQGWDSERISKAMSGSSPATILLKKRYPVYLTYQTAWVDDEGLLQFREDIYGHDKVQAKQLQPTRPTNMAPVAVSAAGM